MLSVEPTANTNEIEDAIDEHYHKWRRLVTHHDPKVVNQANEALQTLETIRATLTNPDQRRIYDAAIGVGEKVMGLGDPEAVIAQAEVTAGAKPPPAPAPKAAQADAAPSKRVDAWVCPECGTPNAIGLRYCNECGAQIGTECTKCDELVEMAAKFCAACGVNQEEARYEAALERQEEVRAEIADLNERLEEARDVVSLLERVASTGKSRKRFKRSRFKDLTHHVPETKRLGCRTRGLIFLVLLLMLGFAYYLTFLLMDSSYLNDEAGILVMVLLYAPCFITPILLRKLLERNQRKKSAKERLQKYQAQIAELENHMKDLQSILPSN
jgi:cell division protein FtsB